MNTRDFRVDVDIFRWSLGDCTNGGVTAHHGRAVLIGPDTEVPASPGAIPVLVLERGRGGREWIAVPVERDPAKTIGPMFGGNFIYSSDARFPSQQPIHVHDRFETPEEYARNCD